MPKGAASIFSVRFFVLPRSRNCIIFRSDLLPIASNLLPKVKIRAKKRKGGAEAAAYCFDIPT